MNYFWITYRGFAFWLGAFYAFTLAWSALELSILPAWLSGPTMLAPVGALVFGAVLPDKALLNGRSTKVVLCVVLAVGLVGCVATAMDDLVQQNMTGFWLSILILVMIASLYSRAIFVRGPAAAASDPPAR